MVRSTHRPVCCASAGCATVLIGLLASTVTLALEAQPFPEIRPATRSQAVTVLTGGGNLPLPCLTPMIQSHRQGSDGSAPALRRAMAALQRAEPLHGERRWIDAGGTVLRYSTSRGTFDRIRALDDDRNGRPDLLESAGRGVREARELLVAQLGLNEPEGLEVQLAWIGANVDGYLVPAAGRGSPARIVLEASAIADKESVRRAAIHQYAHAVALSSGAGIPAAWGEAFATWAVMRATGGPHGQTTALVSGRLGRLAEGLVSDDLRLAAGNAVWLAFVEEAYGTALIRLTLEELARGGPAAAALDLALRRGAGENLHGAFREFQIWSLLVGARSDGRHFSFAERLDSPVFAGVSEGLPALSVRADAPIAPWGAAQVLLRPDTGDGGLRVHFEGDFFTRWEADLLLISERGRLHRLPLTLSPGWRGEVTVPLSGLREAVLLIRNLGDDDGVARRYTWAADRERGYPFELGALEAHWMTRGTPGAMVAWETRSEQHLLGFNIVRTREDGAEPVKVNPVWIPAVGEESETTSYEFLDVTARPGEPYWYRVQGITPHGLTSESEPTPLAPLSR